MTRIGGTIRRLPRLGAMGLIRTYQLIISPLSMGQCKYYPTCSAYAWTAIERFGVFKGGALALWRLARCNPWSRGGVDHVPRRGGDEPAQHGNEHTTATHDPLGAI